MTDDGDSLSAPAPPSLPAFQSLWKAAIDQYDQVANRRLLEDPSAQQLYDCSSAADVLAVVDGQHKDFKAFRDDGKRIREILTPICDLVRVFTDVAGEAASVRG